MASTNKTANIHLNQWAASDPVLREDFNADNAAIDAAFDNILVRKLAEYTTTQAAQVVEFDLSGIDPDDYSELRFCFSLKTDGQYNGSSGARIYFNSAADDGMTVLRYLDWGAESITVPDEAISGTTSGSGSYPPAVWQIDLSIGSADSGGRLYSGVSRCCSRQNGGVNFLTGKFGLCADQLSTLILTKLSPTSSASCPFGAGSKLTVYGVIK